MSKRPSRAQRADDIAAAISRFENGATVTAHDGRHTDTNLAIEAGFGGSSASQRQQLQQYFNRFPELRERWRNVSDAAAGRGGDTKTELRSELASVRRELAATREERDATALVADLWRRKAKQLERQVARLRDQVGRPHDGPRLDPTRDANVVALPQRRTLDEDT